MRKFLRGLWASFVSEMKASQGCMRINYSVKQKVKIEMPIRANHHDVPLSGAEAEKIDVMKGLLDLLAPEEIDAMFIDMVDTMSTDLQMRFQADAQTLIQQINLKHKNG